MTQRTWHGTLSPKHISIVSKFVLLERQLELSKTIEQILQEQCYSDRVLDQSIVGQLVFSRLLFYLIQCLAYHPFLFRGHLPDWAQLPMAFRAQIKYISRDSVIDMVKLLLVAKERGYILASWFSAYCVAVTGTILLLYASVKGAEHKSLHEQYQQCESYLEWLSRYWETSSDLVMTYLFRVSKRN